MERSTYAKELLNLKILAKDFALFSPYPCSFKISFPGCYSNTRGTNRANCKCKLVLSIKSFCLALKRLTKS